MKKCTTRTFHALIAELKGFEAMEIIAKGHSFEDAVRQVLQLFFDINSGGCVLSEKRADEFYVKIQLCEKCAEERRSIPQNSDKRTLTDELKKCVYTAAKKISPVDTPWGISTGIRPSKTVRMMLEGGASEQEAEAFMKNEMWVSPEKAHLAAEVAQNERKILSRRLKNGVSLYIGIPFCPTRCAYCSFISQATKHNEKFIEPYVAALKKEILTGAQLCAEYGFLPETVYFGGGTPTAIPAFLLKELIQTVKESFDMSNVKEFCVEAGRPDTFSDEMLHMLKESGVNRISINPQTMNQKTLELIGRRHTVEQTIAAFEMAGKYNFSINADLIAGLPDESPEDFKNSLEKVNALLPQAITVHTMYLKRAARLIGEFEKYRFVTGVNDMMRFAAEKMRQSGFLPYYMYKQRNTLGNLENVGFCLPGHEGIYNVYIMEEVQTVLAFGAGASTKLVKGDRIERVFNPKEAADYTNRIDEITERKIKGLEFLKMEG